MLGLFWSLGVKIAVFESKTAFLGSDNSGFFAKIIILTEKMIFFGSNGSNTIGKQ